MNVREGSGKRTGRQIYALDTEPIPLIPLHSYVLKGLLEEAYINSSHNV